MDSRYNVYHPTCRTAPQTTRQGRILVDLRLCMQNNSHYNPFGNVLLVDDVTVRLFGSVTLMWVDNLGWGGAHLNPCT